MTVISHLWASKTNDTASAKQDTTLRGMNRLHRFQIHLLQIHRGPNPGTRPQRLSGWVRSFEDLPTICDELPESGEVDQMTYVRTKGFRGTGW